MMEQALAEYLVNALWELPVLAGAAWLLVRLVRPSARVQHGIWLAVLVLAVLLPARGMRRAGVAQVKATAFVAQERAAAGEKPLPFFPPRRDLSLNATASRWLVRLYVATVFLALLRIGRAWYAAHHLVVHSWETHRNEAEVAELSRRFAVEPPQLRESKEASSPMVVGVTAPVLLLPEGFARYTEDEVRAALCHELAHIQRRDYLMNLICQVAASPLAWHPVVHAVQQRIRTTREMVCDALAAQEMESHIGYAKCLLALASSMVGGQRQAQFIGLFSKNTLEERVMRLMDKSTMSVRARVVRAATGAAVMIAAGTLAVMFHVTPTMAEQTKGAAPPTQPEAAQPAAAAPTNNQAEHRRQAARSRRQSAEAQQKMAKAKVILNDPEFKQRMEDAQRQMAKANAIVNSPEFKQRMEEAQRQMEKASAVFHSPEFKQQMENAQRQMAAAKVILDDPEFKKNMEDAQRQMAKAAEVFNSPEFKVRIEEMKHEAEDARRRIEEPSAPVETAPTQ